MNQNDVLSQNKIQQLLHLLSNAKHVGIVCHARPDGDAIGSMVALGLLLRTHGHKVLCISPTAVPHPLRWVSGYDLVVTHSSVGDAINESLKNIQLFFHVDHNSLTRVDSQLEILLRACSAPRVMIDHHIYPSTDEFSLVFSQPDTSSTCELLYELIRNAWGEEAITQSIAECLYMGVLTDTGSFAHACGHKRTFEVAGSLVEHGADVPTIRAHVLGSYSQSRYLLYGTAMGTKTSFFANGIAAIIALSNEFLESHNFSTGDTEGLVNEPLTVEGVKISALVVERKDGLARISLRSRGNAEVNAIARTYFNGGGHPQASGGTLEMPLRKAALFVRLVIARAIETGECFSALPNGK